MKSYSDKDEFSEAAWKSLKIQQIWIRRGRWFQRVRAETAKAPSPFILQLEEWMNEIRGLERSRSAVRDQEIRNATGGEVMQRLISKQQDPVVYTEFYRKPMEGSKKGGHVGPSSGSG